MPDGNRVRWWCKVCLHEGKEWIYGETCEHVRDAEGQTNIPRKEAIATILHFMNEDLVSPASAAEK